MSNFLYHQNKNFMHSFSLFDIESPDIALQEMHHNQRSFYGNNNINHHHHHHNQSSTTTSSFRYFLLAIYIILIGFFVTILAISIAIPSMLKNLL